MGFAQRWQEIRSGFSRPFWVANISELFERLSYYAAFAALANYLHERLAFSTQQTGNLTGFFGGLVWFLAAFGGAVSDRLGFRRALSTAYLILAIAYFLMGSIGSSWLSPVRDAIPLWWVVLFILILPALGIAMVKPSVVGTTASASKENVRSIGYSIYYTLVNVGGALGPFLGSFVHEHLGVENVFRMSAASVFLMFFGVLIFFRQPARSAGTPAPTLGQTARNFVTVITNLRFVVFLLIFSGFWVVYWQTYIALPLMLRAYTDAPTVDRVIATDATMVIIFQVLISLGTRGIPAFRAITLGTLISSFSWLIFGSRPGVWTAVLSLVVLAIGEMVLSPRYYEYVSRLAPANQQGTYMGFAFVPIGIGSIVGGWAAGWAVHTFAEVQRQPQRVWWFFTALGVACAAALWIYDLVVKPVMASEAPASTSSAE